MSRILWTLPYLPWPVTSGGKARQFHLLSRMAARGHAITLLVQSKTPADAVVRDVLEPLLERLIVLQRRPLRSARTLCSAALSPLPLLTTVNGHAPELARTFEQLLAQQWDVVQIEHSYSAEPFLGALSRFGKPFVLTEHNVESALGNATYGKWPWPMRYLAAYDRLRGRRWERHVLSRAARVIAVTAEDARVLSAIGGQQADVVGNGVDAMAFAAVKPAFDSTRVLFVGNFEYAPNIDAVEWALAEIMPRLWQRHSRARFVVCGYAMPARWASLHDDPRIEWRGYVPRLQDVQCQCAVFLAPLRQGGGSKLKVLEAMAAGLPLVSTREGISGLAVRDGIEAIVADQPGPIADALADLLADPRRARGVGEAGRRLIRASHDWSVAADQLEDVYRRLRQGTAQRARSTVAACV